MGRCEHIECKLLQLSSIYYQTIFKIIAFLFHYSTSLLAYISTTPNNLTSPPCIQKHHELRVTLWNNLDILLDLKSVLRV